MHQGILDHLGLAWVYRPMRKALGSCLMMLQNIMKDTTFYGMKSHQNGAITYLFVYMRLGEVRGLGQATKRNCIEQCG